MIDRDEARKEVIEWAYQHTGCKATIAPERADSLLTALGIDERPAVPEFLPPPGEFSGCRCPNCPEKQTPKRKCMCCEDRRISDKYPDPEEIADCDGDGLDEEPEPDPRLAKLDEVERIARDYEYSLENRQQNVYSCEHYLNRICSALGIGKD